MSKRSRLAPQYPPEELRLESLTTQSIFHIAWDIRERSHDPFDALRLLHKFCELFDSEQHVPYELLAHIRHAIGNYVEGKCSLDVAFGLTPGARGREYPQRVEIALSIWKNYLAGKTLTESQQEASAKFGPKKDAIDEMWSSHWFDAIVLYQHELRTADQPRELSDYEKQRADKVVRRMSQRKK